MTVPLPTAIAVPDDCLDEQVKVADGVAIADGVVLDAAPGCRLILSPGVCLGSGVIVQVCRGDLVIEPGVVLGRGVLVVGTGRIGQNACIGADSTLIDPTLAANQVVPPKSLLGDPSQSGRVNHPLVQVSFAADTSSNPGQIAAEHSFSPAVGNPAAGASPLGMTDVPMDTEDSARAVPAPQPSFTTESTTESATESATEDGPAAPESSLPGSPSANGSNVHGQKQVNQLLETLFPHRRSLNGVSPEDKP